MSEEKEKEYIVTEVLMYRVYALNKEDAMDMVPDKARCYDVETSVEEVIANGQT